MPNDDPPTFDDVTETHDDQTHEFIKINVTNELGEKVNING